MKERHFIRKEAIQVMRDTFWHFYDPNVTFYFELLFFKDCFLVFAIFAFNC